jgi:hypothetical protein
MGFYVTHPRSSCFRDSQSLFVTSCVCHAGQCDFMLAVPVKTFDSGDRDLHIIQVTRGAAFPTVTVRFSFSRSDPRFAPV